MSRRRFSYILCESVESFGSLDEFARVLRSLKEFGFEGVEFNITDWVADRSQAILGIVQNLEFPVVSFLTGANYFGKGLCLSSQDPQIRKRAVETLSRFTETAAQFGAILVVGQMQGFLTDEPDANVAEKRIEETLRAVAVAAEKNGTTVVIEPVNHLQCGFHNTYKSVLSLTERIGSPRIKPMLDTFHMNIEEDSMVVPIKQTGKELTHFHLCETNGSNLGSGHLNLDMIFEALRSIDYKGFLSIKVYRTDWRSGADKAMFHLKHRKYV